MNNLRKWIIRKLGGFVLDDLPIKGEPHPEYWDRVYAQETIYVDPCNYTEKNAKSIERALANRLAENLLRQDCMFFFSPVKDHDELRISASCNALKLHERKSYHSPSHLVFEEDKS